MDVEEVEEEEVKRKRHYHRRKKRKKYVEEKYNYEEIDGVLKKSLNVASQKYLELIVGEHVTSEKPWKFITKERLEDDLELHEETTELEDIREDIVNYPGTELLIGYVPAEGTEVDEFYFCLTEAAANKVTDIIAQLQEQRAARLQNTVERIAGRWSSLGSEAEVEELMNKCNRPLIEVELETQYPIISPNVYFKLRRVEDARDGYAEMLCRRYTYNNITKKRVDSSIQSAPSIVNRAIQTVFTYPKNAWTQYSYMFDVPAYEPKKMRRYIERLYAETISPLEEDLLINSTINLYRNDYQKLVNNPKAFSPPPPRCYKELVSLHDVYMSKNKVVGYVMWHPMWTGIIAFSYANIAINVTKSGPSNLDEVSRAIYENNVVLLWSTKDTLKPRLLLESPKDVTMLNFCPFNENILVGGCSNGQIIVWDITNKLKEVEEVEVLTIYQQNYRKIMYDMMDWMKMTKDAYRIRPVAVSNITHSHSNTVTSIEWMYPQFAMNKMGHIETLEEDTSLQFITGSLDGYIMFWDLLAVPTLVPGSVRPPRKLKRLQKRPSALTMDVSPFKILNRVLKPFYKIKLQLTPDEIRPFPVTSFAYRLVKMLYKQKDPNPDKKMDLMNDRLYFYPELRPPADPLTNEIYAATLEGDVVHLSWEGYKYSTGEIVTSEVGTTINFAKYHDGPVVSLEQNHTFKDVYLSVGGKVFAVWKKGFNDQPVFWRRSKSRYTSGIWMKAMSSHIILVNENGVKDIWNIDLRSSSPIWSERTYNVPILQTVTHPFPFKTNILALSTGSASVNIFLYNTSLGSSPAKSIKGFKNLIDREIKRKTLFREWQKMWEVTHPERVAHVIEVENGRKRLFQQQQRKGGAVQEEEIVEEKTEEKVEEEPKPEKEQRLTAEQLQQQWKEKEKDRMIKIMLSLKQMNPELLQQQQIPLKKLEEEIAKKNEKKEDYRGQAEEVFNKAVAMNFPEAIRPKTPPPPDPYAGGDMDKEELDNCVQQYEKLSEELTKSIKPHIYKFNWTNLLDYGRNIRKYLDVELSDEQEGHRARFEKYKMSRLKENVIGKLEKARARKMKKVIRYVTTEDGEEEEEEVEEEIIEEDVNEDELDVDETVEETIDTETSEA
ncbi:WD repeat-containing protein 63 [Agrilus planipennis]|uniref:WD repeat-containing protein 63 n=1 Tax=Agrilus planipennis TaxID=224129 RepID=A0A1W4XID7_AGRPL|nr:WD repeat-containing protein 63 [Agrilus planipennis]